MKLEDQRISPQNTSQSTDPEFLTFRHNSPNLIEPSGRSIFSQRIDYAEIGNSYYSYKSLDKYQFLDTNKKQTNLKSFKKNSIQTNHQLDASNQLQQNVQNRKTKDKYLRNVKSNEKYPYFQQKNKTAVEKHNHKSPINEQDSFQSKYIENERDSLRAKLSRLVKNIKRQQRRQIYNDKEISELSEQLAELDKNIEDQEQSICELEDIGDDNKQECDKIINSMLSVRQKNEELSNYLNQLDDEMDSSQISVQTIKQDSVKDRALCNKMKQQAVELTNIKIQLEERLCKLSSQIQQMYNYIKQNEILEMQIHNVLYK